MGLSYLNPRDKWHEPLTLDDTINTAGEDMCWTFTPNGAMFSGESGPLGSYHYDVMHDVMWVRKEDVPLLKNFKPISPPPQLN